MIYDIYKDVDLNVLLVDTGITIDNIACNRTYYEILNIEDKDIGIILEKLKGYKKLTNGKYWSYDDSELGDTLVLVRKSNCRRANKATLNKLLKANGFQTI
jgi:hypothetical protein